VTTTGQEHTDDPGPAAAPDDDGRRPSDRWVLPLAALGAIAVLLANLSGIALGDDGVGYQATADSLLRGDGLGYFLERPLTVWPPVWPWLMAAVNKLTPLDTLGSAMVLNALMTFLAVVIGHRLLRRVVVQDRLVLLGTAVIALGSSTIGFGHLLMTDFAFTVVLMSLLLLLLNHAESGRIGWLLGAGATIWLAFGLRYVALYLIPIAGLWILLGQRQRFASRLRNAVVFGAVSVVAPVAWMIRNHSIDGTYTGPRYPSARGFPGNAFDILATMGRFLLPGVLNKQTKLWALVALVVLAFASWLGVRIFLATRCDGESLLARSHRLLGGPTGLVLLTSFGYLVYMLYVRSTTALNQLDLRLLYPAYLPLMATALILIAHLGDLGPRPANRWPRRGMAVASVWAAANIAAGLVAAIAFAGGNPYFDGNYQSDTFSSVRDNPALDAIPAGCHVRSNLPNALYPRISTDLDWSPRRTALESNERVDDLERLVPKLGTSPTCLVWIDEQPRYGHLWTRAQLQRRLGLQQLAQHGDVTVYLMTPPAS
jgi:4-amino-4-deoxy-L-arabinose transferase-like glycosyltransferase